MRSVIIAAVAALAISPATSVDAATLNVADYTKSVTTGALSLNHGTVHGSLNAVRVDGKSRVCGGQGAASKCGADLSVSFDAPVMDLSFTAHGKNKGRAIITAFFEGVAIAEVLMIRKGGIVDFSGLGPIDAITIEHRGKLRKKRRYSDFSFELATASEIDGALLGLQEPTAFDQAYNGYDDGYDSGVKAVPLPPAAALFLTGLAGLGLMRRRRKEHT